MARVPEKDENISDSRDRQYRRISILSSSDIDTEDTHCSAGACHQSFDSSGTLTSGLITGRAKSDSENASLDALRLVASVARVICALCTARSRDMAHPDLDIGGLGNVIDVSIPFCMLFSISISRILPLFYVVGLGFLRLPTRHLSFDVLDSCWKQAGSLYSWTSA